jgi:hypothetical protein
MPADTWKEPAAIHERSMLDRESRMNNTQSYEKRGEASRVLRLIAVSSRKYQFDDPREQRSEGHDPGIPLEQREAIGDSCRP